ncbi:MAG: sulfonate transport system permease protein [Halanaerobiales bacterium]|nr:sulfonate transport system permease protein [Halanaerobiales bacterium]
MLKMKNNYFQRLFWILVIAGIWKAISLSGLFSPLIFPSPETVLKSFYLSLLNGELIRQTIISLSLILRGLIISLIIALILSLLAISSKTFAGMVETLLAIAHPLPGIALMPLVLIWFGAGTKAIIFIIVHSVLWPLVLNLLTGFRAIPEIYRLVGENYGLNSLKIMWYIMTPASLPYFLAGIKIGWARAWRALISAEMLFGAAGGIGGLGWYIFKKRVFFDIPGVFAGLIVIVIIGVLVEDLLFNKVEDITVKRWGMQI